MQKSLSRRLIKQP